ncbi:conserved hypothetical protein [Neospora caninum Liverpool]|uniref:Uncharacterized protein n=1 Tax=Neospora caninum (strain Liverpool) TaxID=572307 RepID=F0VCG2_NEOCL|nr:conserved hypothetical protein [Neospora caninum Liverpool]CBZ51284.1 conserved hypothetical protein [Neospora caninum Liverpool]CEL68599.1 TPA: hypothetical protein BN1204_043510 [Neospora caninum Liverpool]|eukprot:XP_003881317.1 conserved hypothetical protein [Neospora caninum Liverpool]
MTCCQGRHSQSRPEFPTSQATTGAARSSVGGSGERDISTTLDQVEKPCAKSSAAVHRGCSKQSVHPPLCALRQFSPQNACKEKADSTGVTSVDWTAFLGGSPVRLPEYDCPRKRPEVAPMTSIRRTTSENLTVSQERIDDGPSNNEQCICPVNDRDQGRRTASEGLSAGARGVAQTASQAEVAEPPPSVVRPKPSCVTAACGNSPSGGCSPSRAESHVVPLDLAVSSTSQIRRPDQARLLLGNKTSIAKTVGTPGDAQQGTSKVTANVGGKTIVVREAEDVRNCRMKEKRKLQGGTSSSPKEACSSMPDAVYVVSSPSLPAEFFWASSLEDPEVRLPPHTWPCSSAHPTRSSAHIGDRQNAFSSAPELTYGNNGGRDSRSRRQGVHSSSRCWLDGANRAKPNRSEAPARLRTVAVDPDEGNTQKVGSIPVALGTQLKDGLLDLTSRKDQCDCIDGCERGMPTEVEARIRDISATACCLFGKAIQKDADDEQTISFKYIGNTEADANFTRAECGRDSTDAASRHIQDSGEAAESVSHCIPDPTPANSSTEPLGALKFCSSAPLVNGRGPLWGGEEPLAYQFGTSRGAADPTVLCLGCRRKGRQDNSSLYSFGPFNYTPRAAVGAPVRDRPRRKIGHDVADDITEGRQLEAPEDEAAPSWPAMAFLFPPPLQQRLKFLATGHSRFKRTMIDLEQGKLRQPRASRLATRGTLPADCYTNCNCKLVQLVGRHERSQLHSPSSIPQRRYPANYPGSRCHSEVSQGTAKGEEEGKRGPMVSAVHNLEYSGVATEPREISQALGGENNKSAKEARHPKWTAEKARIIAAPENSLVPQCIKGCTLQLQSSKVVASIPHTSPHRNTSWEEHDDTPLTRCGADAGDCGRIVVSRTLSRTGEKRSGVSRPEGFSKVVAREQLTPTENVYTERETASTTGAHIGEPGREPQFHDISFDNYDQQKQTQNSEKICLQDILNQDHMMLAFEDETLGHGHRYDNERRNAGNVACRQPRACTLQRDTTSDSKQPKLELKQYCPAGASNLLPGLLPTSCLRDDSQTIKGEAQRGVQSSLVLTRKFFPAITVKKRCLDEVRSPLLKEMSPPLHGCWSERNRRVASTRVAMCHATTQRTYTLSRRTDLSVSEHQQEMANTRMRRTDGLETFCRARGEIDSESEVGEETISDNGTAEGDGRRGAAPVVEISVNQHGFDQLPSVSIQAHTSPGDDTLSQVPHSLRVRSRGASFSTAETEESEGMFAGLLPAVDFEGTLGNPGGRSEASKELTIQDISREAERTAEHQGTLNGGWASLVSQEGNGRETCGSATRLPHPGERWTGGSLPAEARLSTQDSLEPTTAVLRKTETAELGPDTLLPSDVRAPSCTLEPVAGVGQKRSRASEDTNTGRRKPPDFSAPLAEPIGMWPDDEVEEEESGKSFLESLGRRQRRHLAVISPVHFNADDVTAWWGNSSGSDTEPQSHMGDEHTTDRASRRQHQRQGLYRGCQEVPSPAEETRLGLAKSFGKQNELLNLQPRAMQGLQQTGDTPAIDPPLTSVAKEVGDDLEQRSGCRLLLDGAQTEEVEKPREESTQEEEYFDSQSHVKTEVRADIIARHTVAELRSFGLCATSPAFVPQAFQQHLHPRSEQNLVPHRRSGQPNPSPAQLSNSNQAPQQPPRPGLSPEAVTGSGQPRGANSAFFHSRSSSILAMPENTNRFDRMTTQDFSASRGSASPDPFSAGRRPSFPPVDQMEEGPRRSGAALSSNTALSGPATLLTDTRGAYPLSVAHPVLISDRFPPLFLDGRDSGSTCELPPRYMPRPSDLHWHSENESPSCSGGRRSPRRQPQQNFRTCLLAKNAGTSAMPDQPALLPVPFPYRLGGCPSPLFKGESILAATKSPAIAPHHGNAGLAGRQTTGGSGGEGLVRGQERHQAQQLLKRPHGGVVPYTGVWKSRHWDSLVSEALPTLPPMQQPRAPHSESLAAGERTMSRRQQLRYLHHRPSSAQECCSQQLLYSDGCGRAVDCPEQQAPTGSLVGIATRSVCAPGDNNLKFPVVDPVLSAESVNGGTRHSLRQRSVSHTRSPLLARVPVSPGDSAHGQSQGRTLRRVTVECSGNTMRIQGLGHSQHDPSSRVPAHRNMTDERLYLQVVEARSAVQPLIREHANEVVLCEPMAGLETVVQRTTLDLALTPPVTADARDMQREIFECRPWPSNDGQFLKHPLLRNRSPRSRPVCPQLPQQCRRGESDGGDQPPQCRGRFPQSGESVPEALVGNEQVDVSHMATLLLDTNAAVLSQPTQGQPTTSTPQQRLVSDVPVSAMQSLLMSVEEEKPPILTKPVEYIPLAKDTRAPGYGIRGQSLCTGIRRAAPPSRSMQLRAEQRPQVTGSPVSMPPARDNHQLGRHQRSPSFHLQATHSPAAEAFDSQYASFASLPSASVGRNPSLSQNILVSATLQQPIPVQLLRHQQGTRQSVKSEQVESFVRRPSNITGHAEQAEDAESDCTVPPGPFSYYASGRDTVCEVPFHPRARSYGSSTNVELPAFEEWNQIATGHSTPVAPGGWVVSPQGCSVDQVSARYQDARDSEVIFDFSALYQGKPPQESIRSMSRSGSLEAAVETPLLPQQRTPPVSQPLQVHVCSVLEQTQPTGLSNDRQRTYGGLQPSQTTDQELLENCPWSQAGELAQQYVPYQVGPTVQRRGRATVSPPGTLSRNDDAHPASKDVRQYTTGSWPRGGREGGGKEQFRDLIESFSGVPPRERWRQQHQMPVSHNRHTSPSYPTTYSGVHPAVAYTTPEDLPSPPVQAPYDTSAPSAISSDREVHLQGLRPPYPQFCPSVLPVYAICESTSSRRGSTRPSSDVSYYIDAPHQAFLPTQCMHSPNQQHPLREEIPALFPPGSECVSAQTGGQGAATLVGPQMVQEDNRVQKQSEQPMHRSAFDLQFPHSRYFASGSVDAATRSAEVELALQQFS